MECPYCFDSEGNPIELNEGVCGQCGYEED